MRQLPPFRLPDVPTHTNLVVKYFRDLGGPTRLRILQPLQTDGEKADGELTRRPPQLQHKVSNHLACLRWCGFMDIRRDHQVSYYPLADERVAAHCRIPEA